MSEPLYQHHRRDTPRWIALIDAANLEHTGDWPVVQVDLAIGAELVDYQDRITEEVIYAQPMGPHGGQWQLDYTVDYPYGDAENWTVNAELFEPANIVTPGLLDRLFGEEMEAGATVRFQCVVVDTYDCEDCEGGDGPEGGCDHTFGWALVYAIHHTETVQSLNREGSAS